jgi:hypothetical protein
MLSEFLDDVLTKSSHAPDGCGMSTRPEYYSGRGATTVDVNSTKLEKVWTAIRTHRGEAAAEAFVCMVESIQVFSATEFLLALAKLDARGYVWNPSMLPKSKGIHATDDITGFCTVLAVMSRSERDDTATIKNPFLRAHGRKIEREGKHRHPYDWD